MIAYAARRSVGRNRSEPTIATGVSASSSGHPAGQLGMTPPLNEAMPLFVTTEE